jgi:hypothetical protein
VDTNPSTTPTHVLHNPLRFTSLLGLASLPLTVSLPPGNTPLPLKSTSEAFSDCTLNPICVCIWILHVRRIFSCKSLGAVHSRHSWHTNYTSRNINLPQSDSKAKSLKLILNYGAQNSVTCSRQITWTVNHSSGLTRGRQK